MRTIPQMRTIQHECSRLKRIVLRHKIECCIIAAVVLIGLFCFSYIDGMTLTAASVEMWDAVFLRGIGNIREVFAENVRNVPHGGNISGNFLLAELPLAIWNLPLWLTHTFGGNTNVLSVLCLAWSKLFFVFCALLAGLQCYHLVYGMNKREERAELAAIAFWGSGTLMLSVGMAMQDEIVYILTFLLALRCICEGRKAAGLIWMIVTVTFAPFMILAVLVVLLCMSKNILKVFVMAIATYAPFVLSRILLPPRVPSSDDYLDWFFNRTTFGTGIGSLSVFAVVILVAFAVSYFKEYDDSIQQNRSMLYYLTALMGAMCVLSWMHVYRLFLCVPFLIVSLLGVDEKDDHRVKASLLVFAGFELLRTMGAFFSAPYMVTPYYSAPWIQKLSGVSAFESMVDRFEVIIPGIGRFPIIINAFVVGALILMLWLIKMPNADNIISIKLPTKFFSVINTLVPIAFFAVHFFLIFIINIYSVPIGGNDVLAPAIDNNISLDQYYYSNESQHLLQAQVRTVTWGRVYPEDLRFCLDVIDEKTGEVIGSAEVPANQMPNNDICKFDLSGVSLAEDHWYIFRLFAKGTIENEEQAIALLRSSDGTAVDTEHYTVVHNSEDESSEAYSFDVISKITSWG